MSTGLGVMDKNLILLSLKSDFKKIFKNLAIAKYSLNLQDLVFSTFFVVAALSFFFLLSFTENSICSLKSEAAIENVL